MARLLRAGNKVGCQIQHEKTMTGGEWRATTLVALLALAVGGLFAVTTVDGLASPDALRYAQIARNLLAGRGFFDAIVQPHTFSWMSDGSVAAREALGSFNPFFAFPAYLALWFFVFGATDTAAILANLALYAAIVVVFFALARRLWGTTTAFFAVALLGLNGKLLTYTVAGLSEPLYILLAVTAVYLLLRERERFVFLPWIAFLLALMLYTRDLGKLFVGAFFLLAFFVLPRRRFLGLAVLLIFFAASYWLLGQFHETINQRATARLREIARGQANPDIVADLNASAPTLAGRLIDRFGGGSLLVFTELYPGHTLERSLIPVKDSRVFAEHPEVFWGKWRANLRVTARNLAGLLNPLWFVAFVLFPWARRRDSWPLYGWTWLLLTTHIAVNLLLLSMPRYNVIAVPFCLLLAAPVLVEATKRLRSPTPTARVACLAGLVVLGSLPWAFAAKTSLGRPFTESEAATLAATDWQSQLAIGQFLREATAPGEVVVGDEPWVAAWRGDRPAIWLPVDDRQMALLRRRATVDWLFLSFENSAAEPLWREWLKKCGAAGGTDCDGFRFTSARRHADRVFYLFRAVTAEGASPP